VIAGLPLLSLRQICLTLLATRRRPLSAVPSPRPRKAVLKVIWEMSAYRDAGSDCCVS
jgi:hypothetical protein